MLAIGKILKNMGKALMFSQMEIFMMDILMKDYKKERVLTFGKIDLFIRVIFGKA